MLELRDTYSWRLHNSLQVELPLPRHAAELLIDYQTGALYALALAQCAYDQQLVNPPGWLYVCTGFDPVGLDLGRIGIMTDGKWCRSLGPSALVVRLSCNDAGATSLSLR